MAGITNKDLYEAVNGLRAEVRDIYVTKDDFMPVKRAVYGTATMVLIAFVTVLISIVIPNIKREDIATNIVPQSISQTVEQEKSTPDQSGNTSSSPVPSGVAGSTAPPTNNFSPTIENKPQPAKNESQEQQKDCTIDFLVCL